MFFKVNVVMVILTICFAIRGINGGVDDNEIISDDYPSQFGGVKLYSIERDCAMVGGICVHNSDCVSPTSKKGLCPSNQFAGVECCWEVEIKPAPCKQHFGACMPRCHKTLHRPATDCEEGNVCCVLI